MYVYVHTYTYIYIYIYVIISATRRQLHPMARIASMHCTWARKSGLEYGVLLRFSTKTYRKPVVLTEISGNLQEFTGYPLI